MSEKPRKKYDMNSPEARALIDEIVHGTFMKEGTMVAFPTCFPGATVPIPADESHIAALDVSEDHMVYGGTSGRACHLFVGIFHGVTGIVFDRGTVPKATECVAVCSGKSKFVAAVNGPEGGRLVGSGNQGLPFDLIQEWGFSRPAIEELGDCAGEIILHAVRTQDRSAVIGITPGHLFDCDFNESKLQVRHEIGAKGKLCVGSKGGVFGQDGQEHLWRYDAATHKLDRKAVRLPAGEWSTGPLCWSAPGPNGELYLADAAGALYAFDETRGFSAVLGKTMLAPAGPMAVTHDGRVFGFCGDEMARMFCYHPVTKQVANLGVAVSVLERRRYGYVFGAAATGRDGQIFFGEKDDLGHLWLYFPSIQKTT